MQNLKRDAYGEELRFKQKLAKQKLEMHLNPVSKNILCGVETMVKKTYFSEPYGIFSSGPKGTGSPDSSAQKEANSSSEPNGAAGGASLS